MMKTNSKSWYFSLKCLRIYVYLVPIMKLYLNNNPNPVAFLFSAIKLN